MQCPEAQGFKPVIHIKHIERAEWLIRQRENPGPLDPKRIENQLQIVANLARVTVRELEVAVASATARMEE